MISSLISRQLAAEPTYDRFSTVMDKWGYTWEPVEVHTDDDYILTTFHITGKVNESPIDPKDTLGSVLIQHGHTQDAASWLTGYGDNKPFHLQLVDEGYDIWLGNNRGTEYSRGHHLYTADDAQFWDFDFTDMGMYDDPANISAVKAATGSDKITYVGYSQGTIQMHYALSHDDKGFYADNLHRVIQLAPCFYPNVPDLILPFVNGGVMRLGDFGITHLGDTPSWDQDLQTIYENVDIFTYEFLSGFAGKPAVSVKSIQLWTQLGMNNEFEEPVTMD